MIISVPTFSFIAILWWAVKFIGALLLWTFTVYLLHSLSHRKSKFNIFFLLHRHHHQLDYRDGGSKFKWKFLYLNFGDIRLTLDILLMLTLPLLVITIVFPSQGLVLLVFHYCNEVFLSETLIDHNPRLNRTLTKFFAWGPYHLKHHENPKVNLSFIFVFWDKIFRTSA